MLGSRLIFSPLPASIPYNLDIKCPVPCLCVWTLHLQVAVMFWKFEEFFKVRYSVGGDGRWQAGSENYRTALFPPNFSIFWPCICNKLLPSCIEPQPAAFPATMDCIPLSHNGLVVGEVLALWTSRLGMMELGNQRFSKFYIFIYLLEFCVCFIYLESLLQPKEKKIV